MLRLLYVSRSRIARNESDSQLADIIATGSSRNLVTSVTGALIFTGASFAQILEGPDAGVEEIMGSILIDPRHTDIQIIFRTPINQLTFAGWGLVSVDRHADTERQIHQIRSARAESAFDKAVSALTVWMGVAARA